ncbi:hypothetical protein B9Z55_016967 [Caenorhabditis nigoni]|nr:hypothetical protein B9Z55_016967 [Caenorhabditis nigoni]
MQRLHSLIQHQSPVFSSFIQFSYSKMLHFKLILLLVALIAITVDAGDVCDYTQAPLYQETPTRKTRRESLCKDVPPEIECTVAEDEEENPKKRTRSHVIDYTL